jgi:hypothetical protein
LNEKYPELQQSNKPNKKAVRPAMPEFGCQESQVVACRIALHHTGLCAFAKHTGTTPDAPLAGSSISELCLETCMNVFGRNTLHAEKPNDGSLVVLHPLSENRKRTDLVRIFLKVLLM